MIYLLRHGETEWNLARRYQGALDSPLTARGRMQATGMAERLASILSQSPDGVASEYRLVSSPLARAVETASIVGAVLGLPVETDLRLRELSIGAWDGMTKAEIEAQFPGALEGGGRSDWYFRAPGGESFEAARQRVAAWLAETADQPTMAVAHGLIGRMLRGVYAGLDREATLAQKAPQGGFFALSEGGISFIAVQSS